MTSHWSAPDGSKPYYVLARELGEPYRHIINYAEWLDATCVWTPIWRSCVKDAMDYMHTHPDLSRRVFRVWLNEQARREGRPIKYDHLGDEKVA